MSGGCINIWLKKPLSVKEQDLIKKYSVFINSFTVGYLIRLRDLKIRSHSQRKQIYGAIGYIPTYEIYICGLVDDIFLSAEAILKELGGFLQVGFKVSQKEFEEAKGICYRIRNTRVNYCLLDWEFTGSIFNTLHNETVKKPYSIKNFKENKLLHLDIN